MRITYDAKIDALSIVFSGTLVTTKRVDEGIAVEYDDDGRIAGLEILDASRRFGDSSTFRQVVLQGVGPAAPAA